MRHVITILVGEEDGVLGPVDVHVSGDMSDETMVAMMRECADQLEESLL